MNVTVAHFDSSLLSEVKTSLSRTQYGTKYYELLGNVERRLDLLRSAGAVQDVEMIAAEGADVGPRDWRHDVKIVLQDLITPEPLLWADDSSLRDAQFIARALSEVDNLFRR